MRKILLVLSAAFIVLPLAAQPHRKYHNGKHSSNRVYDRALKADWTTIVPLGGFRSDSFNHRKSDVLHHLNATQVNGFQASPLPKFVVAGQNNRFVFAIGGHVTLRAAYDLGGIIDGSADFVPYDIPVPSSPHKQERLNMSANTSRLFFKTIANTRSVGRIVTYIETDFRGADNTLRLRKAYVQLLGFTAGQDVTTFCDLTAAPVTIDFRGPNAYNFNFNTMIRYTHAFNRSLSIGAALEKPNLSGTYTTAFAAMPQRVPDLPLYFQWNFGERGSSHLRATGVFRDLQYYDLTANKSKDEFGWGAQISGNLNLANQLNLTFQAVCGEGITPYIQDLTGSGLDLVPNIDNPDKMQTLPMYGWQAAFRFKVEDGWFFSAGYSQVGVDSQGGYKPDDMYKRGMYIFTNMFYDITPSCKIAMEYLFGNRKNMDGQKANANRIQAMIQYNF